MARRELFSSLEWKTAQQFPGLLLPTREQAFDLYRDKQTLYHGEVIRVRGLCRLLDERAAQNTRLGYKPEVAHAVLCETLHNFYVGNIKQRTRETMPMYRGSPSDFKVNDELMRRAMDDVEGMYAELARYLPKELVFNRRRVATAQALARPESVSTDDYLELIDIMRYSSDPLEVFFARCKLVLAQHGFEARRNGHAPEQLEEEARDIDEFLGRNLFEEPEGEPVHVVVKLDPGNDYLCKSWQVVASDALPTPSHDTFIIPARRFFLRHQNGSGRIPLFYFIRPKRHLVTKALLKEIRFLELIGIGDAIAMMFVVAREHLDAVVQEVRRVDVPCPGQACDQGSSIGYRLGQQRLDRKNRQSSKHYEATKANVRNMDRIVELQFVPTISWINSLCSHSDVNHGIYKLKKYLREIFPLLYPQRLVGVPWKSGSLRRQCRLHALSQSTNGSL